MLFRCYTNDSFTGEKDMSRALLRKALESYSASEGIAFDADETVIGMRANGKPVISDDSVFFNVSHTGNKWICIIGRAECGIDIQEIRECSYIEIAAKHFKQHEREYTERNGLRGFFEIWVRREAFGKYTGDGFYGIMPEFAAEGRLLDAVPAGHECSSCEVMAHSLAFGEARENLAAQVLSEMDGPAGAAPETEYVCDTCSSFKPKMAYLKSPDVFGGIPAAFCTEGEDDEVTFEELI